MRIAEAQSAITVGGNVYTPLAGCEISAVKHTIGGETPSLEITAAHNSHRHRRVRHRRHRHRALRCGRGRALYRRPRQPDRARPDVFRHDPADQLRRFRPGVVRRARAIGRRRRRLHPDLRADVPHRSVLVVVRRQPGQLTSSAATVAAIINRFNFTVSIAPADNYLNGGVVLTATGVAFEIASQTGVVADGVPAVSTGCSRSAWR